MATSTKKGLFQLLSGTLGVQLIAFAFYPYLSRIYTPKEFGTFGVFTSFVIILGIFSTSQLHLLFPHPEKEDEANSLYLSTLTYVFFTFVLTCTGMIVFRNEMKDLIGNYKYILPISIVMFSVNEINKMWFIRHKDYVHSSLFVNINRLTSNVLKVGFPKTIGLIISELLANTTSTVFFLRRYAKDIFKTFKNYNLSIFVNILKDNWKYPSILAIGSLSQYMIWEFPIIFLAKIFSKDQVGQFVVANKLTIQTFILAIGAFSLVVQNRLIGDIKSRKKITGFFFKIITLIFCTTIPVIAFLHFFGIDLFKFFLGAQWEMAGQISIMLSPLIFSKVLFGPFYGLFMATKRIEFLSMVRFTQFIVLVIFFNFFIKPTFLETVQVIVLIDFISDFIAITIGAGLLRKIHQNTIALEGAI